ncbi:hypothetical protein Pan216_10550 [Planctomycetes bacterium Pan216]|uniref:Uncharacterized protein n=1 Tax=Kolteria novifilia TaxID=2527975 RepID=A0A518AZP7_9BACT|nr:hypothetical protein Pan216_10550 [Planctomycetes bacterium Pan216]
MSLAAHHRSHNVDVFKRIENFEFRLAESPESANDGCAMSTIVAER